MADLNVFQLTNQELHKSENKTTAKTPKKSVKESVSKTKRRSRKISKPFSIPANKLQLESLRHFLEADGDDDVSVDVTADYTPEDDVVLVIDPDMEEVPEDTDAAIDAAEELVGQHVCKCAICGANYVSDAEITEDVEIEDTECPVCGETGDQIVVGVITPTEELSDEDSEELDDVDVDVDEEEFDDAEDVDVDVEEDEDEDFEESVRRSRMRTMKRRAESVRRDRTMKSRRSIPTKRIKNVNEDYSFDEMTFNRMLTQFAKENYSNVKSVKISKGTVRGNRLTLEGIVTTTRGSKRSIKFVAENFKPSSRMSLKFKEFGPFTESVKNSGTTFIVECVCKSNKIIPAALRYSFKAKNAGMKESRNMYSVTGKVLSESVKNRRR
jgi:hypothetical protein